MKFKVKRKPDFFEKYTTINFAWFPIRIENTIIWLEKYECTYMYIKDNFWNYYYWEVYETKLINY